MSHDRAIASGQEHRKPWQGSARYDQSCRPGGSCTYCESNRMHSDRQRQEAADQQLTDYRRYGLHGVCDCCHQPLDEPEIDSGERLMCARCQRYWDEVETMFRGLAWVHRYGRPWNED